MVNVVVKVVFFFDLFLLFVCFVSVLFFLFLFCVFSVLFSVFVSVFPGLILPQIARREDWKTKADIQIA